MAISALASLATAIGPGANKPLPVVEEATSNKKAKKEDIPEKIMSKDDKFDILAALNKNMNKQLDTTSSIVRLGSKVGQQVPSTVTGITTLDLDVLGCGGVPRGRIIEIYGPESSGKTTIALLMVAAEQQTTDNLCAIVDAEHALDVNYTSSLGVNVDELVISQPDCGEDALEIVDALVESKTVSIIIVDSVAALVPKAELEGEYTDSNMGLHARLMSKACRRLMGKAARNGVTIIFINQIRSKIGVIYGSPEVTTGGNGLKFAASVRLDVRRREVIKIKDEVVGHKLNIKAVKNKMGPPLRETLVDLIYGKGIDKEADLIGYAVKLDVIQRKGAWYSFMGIQIGQGLDATIAFIKDDVDTFAAIRKGVTDKIEELRAKEKDKEKE